MTYQAILKWLETSEIGLGVGQSTWLFPAAETVHVIAIALVVGSITSLDLRLLGLSWRERPVMEVMRDILPWTWASFVIAAIAGILMFLSAATKYAVDTSFRLKLVLLISAGLNMIIFHYFTGRDVARWHDRGATPLAAKFAGGFSLVLWVGIVACGRWIGFTIQSAAQ